MGEASKSHNQQLYTYMNTNFMNLSKNCKTPFLNPQALKAYHEFQEIKHTHTQPYNTTRSINHPPYLNLQAPTNQAPKSKLPPPNP